MYGSQSTHAWLPYGCLLFSGFPMSTIVWPTALKLGYITNLTCLFSWWGSLLWLIIICSRSICIKPWLNRLASGCKSTQVFDLRFNLRWLALTLVELQFRRKWTQGFHRLTTQRKARQTDRKSSVYAWSLRLFTTCVSSGEPTCESVWPPSASLYASSGFANLHRLTSTSLARAWESEFRLSANLCYFADFILQTTFDGTSDCTL